MLFLTFSVVVQLTMALSCSRLKELFFPVYEVNCYVFWGLDGLAILWP